MRTKFSGILTLLLAFVVQLTFAQEKTVSGTVSDSDGLPLPTATVLIKGTTTGTTTDFDGNYSISASEGQVLQFSFVGYATQEMTVGASNTINVTLEADNALEEVVVTAIGIKREKKALGYSVSTVGSEELEQKAEGDIARVLNGKAAGVNIAQTSGLSGSGTNVIIRGYSSITGSNQALFIVDGVPFSSDTNATGGAFVGNNGSSRFLDLNPDNIESVSVLKGLAAATLYGSDGRNGVILITTKTGSANKGALKNEISVSQSYFVNEVASLPDYQNKFGNGFDQSFGWFFSNWGPGFYRDGLGGWGSDAAFDADGTLPHPYSTFSESAAFPQFAGVRYPWRPYDSVKNFFRKGSTSTTNISLRGASEKVAYNVAFGHLDEEGFTPGNGLRRNTLSIGGRSQLSNKFTISSTLNYSRTDFTTPPVAESRGNGTFSAGTSSVFGHLFFTPRSVDLIGLPYANPVDGSSVYYRQGNDIQHPLWTVNNAKVSQLTNRLNGQASLQYDFNDNLNIVYRAGLDVYNELTENYQNKGGLDSNVFGYLTTYNILNEIWDHNLLLNGDYDLTDKIGMTFNLGATTRSESFTQIGAASTGQNIFNVNYHFNFEETNPVNNVGSRNIVGVYGQTQLDYDNMLFVTLAGRNDWVSNIPQENNSLFYPSASIAFLPTAAFDGLKSDNGLNYLKLRASLGQSARFPSTGTYATSQTLDLFTKYFQVDGQSYSVNTTSSTYANVDLKPELQTEIEFGLESKFWNNRISFEASYFKRNTTDLIISRPLGPANGYTTQLFNIGEVEGDGIEADLKVDIFRSEEADGFNWNSSVNFTTNESIVTDLGPDIDQIIYSGTAGLGGNVAREGYQLGSMVGTRIQRDANGNYVVGANGSYIIENVDEEGLTPVIGDPNPDYVMNFVNTFSYKNFTLGVQVNHTVGGDISSATIATLLGRGLSTDTEDRLNTFVLPGVQADGSTNTVQINNSDYYFNNVLFGPKELSVYDASVIRLQEVSLSYSLPTKMLDKTPFGSVSITASGNNLWYNAYNTPEGTNFDPGVALGVGNARGFEFINGPSGKRYGVSVKATF